MIEIITVTSLSVAQMKKNSHCVHKHFSESGFWFVDESEEIKKKTKKWNRNFFSFSSVRATNFLVLFQKMFFRTLNYPIESFDPADISF